MNMLARFESVDYPVQDATFAKKRKTFYADKDQKTAYNPPIEQCPSRQTHPSWLLKHSFKLLLYPPLFSVTRCLCGRFTSYAAEMVPWVIHIPRTISRWKDQKLWSHGLFISKMMTKGVAVISLVHVFITIGLFLDCIQIYNYAILLSCASDKFIFTNVCKYCTAGVYWCSIWRRFISVSINNQGPVSI